MDAPEALNAIGRIPEHAAAAACFGAPTTAGDRTLIPVADVMYGLGVGWGGGEYEREGIEQKGGGGGGGGGSRVRGVAVIEVAPSGVQVHPIIDRTAISLAGIALIAAAIAIAARTIGKLARR